MSKNQVDIVVRRMMFFSKMFTKSWGRAQSLRIIKQTIDEYFSKRLAIELVERYNPRMIISKEFQKGEHQYMEGRFISPLASHSPSLFTSENTTICNWKGLFTTRNPIGTVIILAPTGDHSYYIREYQFANHLLKSGVNTIMVENPFYGSRKPKAQFRSALENVADLFILGASLITECVFLFKWLNDSKRYPRSMGISGLSMGGFNASLTATNVDFPIAVVPCMTWSSAAPIFTRGALSHSINWKQLEAELDSQRFRDEFLKLTDCDWLDKLYAKSTENVGFSRAQKFMWILMEQFTNLSNFSTPLRPELAKFVIGSGDAYIERDGAPDIREIWPGTEVLTLDTGHVQGILQHTHHFRSTILEMLKKTDEYLKNEHLRTQ